MGILNVTPDSFSDGGRFDNEDIVEVARGMLEDGADILDIGGESTGPTGVDVSLEEELRRVIPAIKKLRENFPDAILSIDTWKSEVAEEAAKLGVKMINDVTAGRSDERIFDVAAKYDLPIVLMYSKNNSPRTDRSIPHYDDVVKTVKDFLRERIAAAKKHGVKKIILDPGMGAFVSGDPAPSFEIIERIEELNKLGYPVLVGTSRKGFLGEDRLGMTLWTTGELRSKIDYLRVHDVTENLSLNMDDYGNERTNTRGMSQQN